jgi:hypothetical protein
MVSKRSSISTQWTTSDLNKFKGYNFYAQLQLENSIKLEDKSFSVLRYFAINFIHNETELFFQHGDVFEFDKVFLYCVQVEVPNNKKIFVALAFISRSRFLKALMDKKKTDHLGNSII